MLGFPGIVVAELHIGMILYVMTINDLCSSDLTNGVTVRWGAMLRAESILLTGVPLDSVYSYCSVTANPVLFRSIIPSTISLRSAHGSTRSARFGNRNEGEAKMRGRGPKTPTCPAFCFTRTRKPVRERLSGVYLDMDLGQSACEYLAFHMH